MKLEKDKIETIEKLENKLNKILEKKKSFYPKNKSLYDIVINNNLTKKYKILVWSIIIFI